MNKHTTTGRRVAAIAVAAAVTGIVSGVVATGTAQATPGGVQCGSEQVTAALLPGEPGAGQRYAYLQLTARPGQTCVLPGHLPVTLTGAHNVLIDDDVPAGAPPVTIGAGTSARVLLHWTAIEAEQDQQTPLAITVDAPAITLQWNQGRVDATPASHTIDVGAVTAVPA